MAWVVFLLFFPFSLPHCDFQLLFFYPFIVVLLRFALFELRFVSCPSFTLVHCRIQAEPSMDITMSMEPLFIDDLGCFPASLLLPQIDDTAIWYSDQIFVMHDPAHSFCMYFSNGKLN